LEEALENSEESVQKSTVKSYRDLRVWNEAMTLAESCYLLTRGFPKDELYGMTAQIRRAAASVPANIAEAYGREGRGEYLQFLRVAQGSLKELETHVLLSQRVGLTPEKASAPVLDQCEAVGKMLHGLIRSLQRKGA
jgi:four helix bundle protein